MTRERRTAGFTAVELIILVAVIGIIAAVAFAGIRQVRDRAHFEEAIRAFETRLEGARRLAKAQDVDVEFAVSQDGGRWFVGVNGEQYSVPRAQFSDELTLTLEAPYGTANYPTGGAASIDVTLGNRSATLNVVGVLARTVVVR